MEYVSKSIICIRQYNPKNQQVDSIFTPILLKTNCQNFPKSYLAHPTWNEQDLILHQMSKLALDFRQIKDAKNGKHGTETLSPAYTHICLKHLRYVYKIHLVLY